MTDRATNPAGVEEILELFRGRRRSARTMLRRSIHVTGPNGEFRGRTINISRHGALVAIEDDRFVMPGTASLMEVADLVRAVFPRSFTIRFRRLNVAVEAEVVRVTQHPTRSLAALGCQFPTPLSRRQCEAIGIVFDPKGDAREWRAAERPPR